MKLRRHESLSPCSTLTSACLKSSQRALFGDAAKPQLGHPGSWLYQGMQKRFGLLPQQAVI